MTSFNLFGDDGLTLPFVKAGAVGVVSVASHCVGLQINDMINACKANNDNLSNDIDARLSELDVLFISSNHLGFSMEALRLPLLSQ